MLDPKQLDGRFLVNTPTVIETAHAVVRAEGTLADISSGSTVHIARRIAKEMGWGNTVGMFSEGGWKYLSAKPWDTAGHGFPALDNSTGGERPGLKRRRCGPMAGAGVRA